MDAPKYRALNTTKALGGQGEVFESMNKVIYDYNSWLENKETNVQIIVVKRHRTCHLLCMYILS